MQQRMTEREKIEGRLAAAKVNGGAKAATPRGGNRYTVEGRKGDRYTVQAHTLDDMSCDCKAGLHGVACWGMRQRVYLRIVAEKTLIAA